MVHLELFIAWGIFRTGKQSLPDPTIRKTINNNIELSKTKQTSLHNSYDFCNNNCKSHRSFGEIEKDTFYQASLNIALNAKKQPMAA